MRAVIYAIYDRSSWTWRMSLDATLSTDKRFWTSISADQPAPSMYRVADELPYGQAIAMVRQMNDQAAVELTHPAKSGMNRQAWGEVEISSYVERLSLGEVSLEKKSDIVDDRIIHLEDNVQFWDKLSAAMKGRSLLWEELVSLLEYLGVAEAALHWKKIVQWAYLSGYILLNESLVTSNRRSLWRWGKHIEARCKRCGHSGELIRWSACASCGDNSCAYCESCLTMGRTRACAPLIMGTNELIESQASPMVADLFDITAPMIPLGDWQLSAAQLAASEAGIRHLLRRDRDSSYKPFLIWAVTGAGKTEMIFPLVATELLRGGKVLIATPRRDVVLELLPRIKTAFPHQHVIALYGGSTQRWELGDITIATTHQLLRYEGAYDLVVIDEIDAFPYHNNPVLEYAAQKVRSHKGAVVLLSATPPTHLQVDARKGRIAHVKVPVRYHGKPLPTPRILRYGGIHKLHTAAEKKSPIPSEGESLDTAAPDVKSKLLRWLPSRDGSGQLATIIAESLERGAQLFIFVPAIHRLEPTLAWVRSSMDKLCNRTQIEATSSQDEHRHDKILRFRAASTRILLTTTILERGVTIPKADVIVLDADSALFDAAALVQMAGRAGRSAVDPFGKVYFLSREHTRAQTEAINQIRAMNRLAERRGYISKGSEF
jgi:competence protein ComFA